MATEAVRLRDPAREELGGRIERGFAWKVLSQLTTQGTKTVVMVILARLLGPKEFGIAAMVLVLSAFVVPFSDLGLGIALVQRRKITELERSTMFWTSLAAGVLFTLVGILASPLVADFYGEPSVAPLFAVLSLTFLITGAGSTQRALLSRAMNFRALELRLMVGVVIGGAVGVVLALLGYGPWALIGQQLASETVSTGLLWVTAGWTPKFLFSGRAFRDLGAFGARYLGGTTFLTLNQNVDNLLVGRYLGAAALGAYGLAYSVILVPLSRIVYPFQQVLGPAFARLQDDRPALAHGWIRGARFLTILCLPVMVTIAVTANDVVLFLFGERWHEAAPVVRILALVCGVLCVHGLNDQVMQALGQMRVYLRMCGLSFALNLTAFVVGLQWGIVGVAAGFAISTTTYLVLYTVVVTHAVGTSTRRFYGSLFGVAQAGFALAVVEIAVHAALVNAGAASGIRILVTGLAGAAVFVPVCLWRVPEAVFEVRRLARRIRSRPATAAPQLVG